MVGPGRVLDTERYFLICPNVLGGCMGTTGPQEIDPASGEPWALSFPVITIRDMVRAQKLLIEHLGIERPSKRLRDAVAWEAVLRVEGDRIVVRDGTELV